MTNDTTADDAAKAAERIQAFRAARRSAKNDPNINHEIIRPGLNAGDPALTDTDLGAILDRLRQVEEELEQFRSDARYHQATYPSWLHRQLRHAYRAGHADVREEIRHAIVGTGRDPEALAARYVDAWIANALNEAAPAEPEPCDGDCDCDCQPGRPCLCPERDCRCGPCPVCDRNEAPWADDPASIEQARVEQAERDEDVRAVAQVIAASGGTWMATKNAIQQLSARFADHIAELNARDGQGGEAATGCLCPHDLMPDGTLVPDGVIALGCPVHDAAEEDGRG